MSNALGREENAPAVRAAGGDRRSASRPTDFEVFRTEQLTRTSTVLLVDMSRSMLLRGCFLAAKKVAVALDTLIRTQYPRDHLSVIGFAYYAREIRPEALAELTWHGYEYGTNLQHGLLLARRILARHHAANREIVVITDGEPTAHFEDGQVEFSYPPTRRTIQRDPARGAALHEGRDHDQHVHARAVAGPGRVRGPHDPAQPRPGLLRRRPSTSASTSSSISSAPDEAGVVGRLSSAASGVAVATDGSRSSVDLAQLLPLFLFLHVLGAIIVFGPTFAFPIIASRGAEGAAARELRCAPGRARSSDRIVIPGAIFQGITGLLPDPGVLGCRPHESA